MKCTREKLTTSLIQPLARHSVNYYAGSRWNLTQTEFLNKFRWKVNIFFCRVQNVLNTNFCLDQIVDGIHKPLSLKNTKFRTTDLDIQTPCNRINLPRFLARCEANWKISVTMCRTNNEISGGFRKLLISSMKFNVRSLLEQKIIKVTIRSKTKTTWTGLATRGRFWIWTAGFAFFSNFSNKSLPVLISLSIKAVSVF